jgi:hypothetical protein
MPNPIRSVSHRDYTWPEQPGEREDLRAHLRERADERHYGVCASPRRSSAPPFATT